MTMVLAPEKKPKPKETKRPAEPVTFGPRERRSADCVGRRAIEPSGRPGATQETVHAQDENL